MLLNITIKVKPIRRLQATFFLAYLAFLGVAWYSIGIGYLFGAMLGPLQVCIWRSPSIANRHVHSPLPHACENLISPFPHTFRE